MEKQNKKMVEKSMQEEIERKFLLRRKRKQTGRHIQNLFSHITVP
jgi:hypothetical protein